MDAVSTLFELLEPIPAERTAVIVPEPNIRVSYGQLRSQIEALAEALAAAGVKRGDRVGIALPNGLPVIVSFLAAAIAGTAAPLNPAYKEDEFRFYLEDTAAQGADPSARRRSTKRAAPPATRVPILTIDMDAERHGRALDGRRRPNVRSTPPSVDDVALVLHTSGSTGRPKRVPLAHANLSISARNVARHYALGPDDVSLCVMPLFHVHGLVASTLATLVDRRHGRRAGEVQPAVVLARRADHGVTWYSAVPTLHQLLLARVADPAVAAPAGTEKLRFIRSCSASLPPQVMHALEAAFGAPVLEAYGMTEAAHQMASNPLPPADAQAGIGRPRHRRADQHHGRGRQPSADRRARRSRDQGTERHHAATRTIRKRTRRRSSTAGSAPAIRAFSTRTAT